MKGALTIHFHAANGANIGFGHLGRCREIARAMKRVTRQRAACSFVAVAPEARSFLGEGEFMLREAPGECDIAFVDSYIMPKNQLSAIDALAKTLVVLDDLADNPRKADIIVNGNLYARTLDYSDYEAANFLLGPEYAPIYIPKAKKSPASALLATFGLSRLSRNLLTLIPQLRQLAAGRPILLVMPEYLWQEAGVDKDGKLSKDIDVEVRKDIRVIPPRPIWELATKADVFVSGLGVTYLELLAAHCRVLGVCLADNQKLAYEAACALGLPAACSPGKDDFTSAIKAMMTATETVWNYAFGMVRRDAVLHLVQKILKIHRLP